jgi:hypothetical protein
MINFETLKFKERDEMEDIFSSYLKKHNFDMEHHRDNRMRALYGKQYDHRSGGVDWDY